MLRRAALDAIAVAIEQDGDLAAAKRALRREDPLLRPFARARLERAVRTAETTAREGLPEAEVLRLAYLHLLGAAPDGNAADDGDAVASAFAKARAEHPVERRKRLWWMTSLLVALLAVTGGLGAAAIGRSLHPPPRPDASRRAGPPPRGAYVSGGKPDVGEPSVARALGTDVPEYLIALDGWSKARREGGKEAELPAFEAKIAAARARATAPDVARSLGDAATRRLDEVLAAARSAAEGPREAAEAQTEALLTAVGAFDDELAAAGLGYFLDGDVIRDGAGSRLVILYAFTVEQVGLFESAGATVRALALRRLDHLNWSHTLLGFTRPHFRDALVLLDPIDKRVATYVLPALAPDAEMPLFDDVADPKTASARTAVEKRAGELARTEYLGQRGLDPALLGKMGVLLSRRRALFRIWQKALEARRLILAEPTSLRMEPETLAELEGYVPRAELADLASIEKGLAEPACGPAFEGVSAVLATSVERHEVQHRLDYAREAPLEMPGRLATYVGPVADGGQERRPAARARDEMSAYLAELARDERTPRVSLSLTARFLFDRTLWGTPECYAALVILEGLAASLGLAATPPYVVGGSVERARVADAYLELTARPPETLRTAARALWEDLFHTKLPELRKK